MDKDNLKWAEEFDAICPVCKSGIKQFISNLLKAQEESHKKTLEDIIKLSDEIETGITNSYDDWRAFKQFRNTLRDKYLIK